MTATGPEKRNDFNAPIVELLKKRAGNACSYPGCKIPTSGPRSDGGAINSGIACHIIPAAGKGPRAIAKDDRDAAYIESLANGIWMCGYHGGLIDRDDGRFSIDALHEYRNRREAAAEIAQNAAGSEGPIFGLVPVVVSLGGFGKPRRKGEAGLSMGNRAAIFDFVADTGAREVWPGDAWYAVAVALAEITLNAVTHGEATGVVLESSQNQLTVTAIGDRFTLSELSSQETPGGAAFQLRYIAKALSGVVSVTFKQASRGAQYIFTGPLLGEIRNGDPCIVYIDSGTAISVAQLDSMSGCSAVHIKVDMKIMMSDRGAFRAAVNRANELGAVPIIHSPNHQLGMLKAMLDFEGVPHTRVIFSE